MTAPMPPRPAIPSRLFRHVWAMAAYRTRFSPAGPMAITSAFPPSRSQTASHVSRIHFPQRSFAGLISTDSSVMER